jgi:3-oxoacyl-[acyl-carrier protein] reductase
MSSEILITGMGAISPLGLSVRDQNPTDAEWAFCDVSAAASRVTGAMGHDVLTIPDSFAIRDYVKPVGLRRKQRFSQIAMAATVDAYAQGSFADHPADLDRVGIVATTEYGPQRVVSDYLDGLIGNGLLGASPGLFTQTVYNVANGQASLALGLRGANSTLVGGSAVAEAFLRDGAAVAVNHRSDTPETLAVLERLAGEYPGQVLPVRADVSSLADIQAMFHTIKAEWGGLDVQVNNAGHNRDGFALMMKEDAWRSVIDTDLTGAFFCTRQAAWLTVQRRSGSIINIASVSAFTSPAGQANYAAAKAGVVAFTRTLAKELGRQHVRVNAVAPGLIETDMIASLTPVALDEYLSRIPGGRVGRADEVAEVVRFLASPAAAYINGHCVVVDGGLTA